jgi:hypothetical protein
VGYRFRKKEVRASSYPFPVPFQDAADRPAAPLARRPLKEAAHTIALRMLHAAALGCLGVSSRH